LRACPYTEPPIALVAVIVGALAVDGAADTGIVDAAATVVVLVDVDPATLSESRSYLFTRVAVNPPERRTLDNRPVKLVDCRPVSSSQCTVNGLESEVAVEIGVVVADTAVGVNAKACGYGVVCMGFVAAAPVMVVGKSVPPEVRSLSACSRTASLSLRLTRRLLR